MNNNVKKIYKKKMNTPYPVRLEKGHVVMSDGSVLSPPAIKELVKSLGKKSKIAETYPVKIDKNKGVITNNKDRIDSKLLGAVSNASKYVKPKREAMRWREDQYDEYGRFKKHFESYDEYVKNNAHGKPPLRQSADPSMPRSRVAYEPHERMNYRNESYHYDDRYSAKYDDYMNRKAEYDNRASNYHTAENYGNEYYNKTPYAFDTTPSPFHSVDRRRYFPVSQAYGTDY